MRSTPGSLTIASTGQTRAQARCMLSTQRDVTVWAMRRRSRKSRDGLGLRKNPTLSLGVPSGRNRAPGSFDGGPMPLARSGPQHGQTPLTVALSTLESAARAWDARAEEIRGLAAAMRRQLEEAARA